MKILKLIGVQAAAAREKREERYEAIAAEIREKRPDVEFSVTLGGSVLIDLNELAKLVGIDKDFS